MESHISTLIKEQFNSTDLYEILDIPRDADKTLINQAYRKLALRYHPDRANGDVKKFQALSSIHSILSDESKRKIYDQVGNVDDAGAAEDQKSFDEWYSYFRNMFPNITVSNIENFSLSYRGSEEEKADVQELYTRFQGDLFLMHNYLMCSDDPDAENRICSIIDELIANGSVSSSNGYKKSKSKFIANAPKRLAVAAKQAAKAAKRAADGSSSSAAASSSSSSSSASLEELILARQRDRAGGLASLLARYGDEGKSVADRKKAKHTAASSTSGRKSSSARKGSHIDDDDDDNDDNDGSTGGGDDISDEAFQATQARILSQKSSAKDTKKSKQSRPTKSN